MPHSPHSPHSENHSNERILLDRLLAEREAGWAEFLKAYGGYLKGLIWTFGLSHEDSEEVFQNTCLRLAKEDAKLLREWDPERCSLRGYLSVVTSSVVANFIKSRFHRYSKGKVPFSGSKEFQEEDVISLLRDSAPSPLERLLRIEFAQRARERLEAWYSDAGISERDQRLLELRLSGLSYREIAKVLGLSETNATVRFHRLRKEFELHFLG